MQIENMSPSSFIDFKVSTLKLILLLGAAINLGYTFFAFFYFAEDQRFLGWSHFAFFLEMLLLYRYFKKRPDTALSISLILAFSGFVFFCIMALLVPENSFRLIWFLPLIIFSFFFINAITGLSILILTLCFVLLAQSYLPTYLSEDALYSLILCLIAIGILAHHFSKQIHSYETAIIEQNQQLQNLVTHDQMTGVLNRQGLLDGSEQYFNLASRHYISALCLVVFDVDHFKLINDNYGHLVGDKSIKLIAKLVKRALRKSDLIARMGGDEFVLLLPETNARQAEKLMIKIQNLLSETPLTVGSDEIYMKFSAGIAQHSPQHTSFKELFKTADEALYKAKERGRNQFCMAESDDEMSN
ncbi:GGDEF domain-containing protein [Hydrogenovibrio kuenenii]|uniref:GGDEF domain-containing protein n=1 Tax=Hydrogenovibrio kuenenii TaxID=63658 RepID=UPI0004679E03|nr:GGDEF domain-containing protein [Hydrogenovibrio kuenenii]